MNNKFIVLEVPFQEKEEAKQLGARWNPNIKKWYIPHGLSPKDFEQWIPNDNNSESVAES